MRVLHWITPLLSLVITCAITSSGVAQIPGDIYPGDSYWTQPGFTTNNPNVFVPPGAQGNFQPYPGIDMFQYGWQQTRNENGIWIQDQRRPSREYHWGADFLRVWFDRPGDRLFGFDGWRGPQDPISNFAPRTGDDGGSDVPLINNFAHQPRSTGAMFKDGPQSTGFRIFGGWTDEDDSSVMFNAWWTEKGEEYFLRGSDPFLDPLDPLFLNLFPYTLQTLNGSITVDDGTGRSITIPFDQKYELNYSVQAWGAGVTILRPVIRRGSWYKIRPIIGLRYLHLDERIAFSGLDSGAEYTIEGLDDGSVIEEQETLRQIREENAGNGTAAPGRPNNGTINTTQGAGVIEPVTPYETSISASNSANIAGPEVGLRLDAGGKRTNAWVSVVGGLAVNAESQQLRGFGVYNHFIDSDLNGVYDGDEFTPQTVFEDNNTTTHISPIFEATAALEMDIFGYVPILKRNDVFANHSKFRVAYSFLYVGEVARPHESIEFVSFPANPRLRTDRRGWNMQTLSLTAEFEY